MGDNWINTAGVIKDALRTLCFWLCSFIYEAVIIVYNIFEKLCGGRFLDNKMLESFAQRVGVILGLVMAFIVIFTIIKMVLDPDKISDKEMGVTALLRKIIIVVIMLGFSNFVFNALYIVQKTVIESDAITKLLLPIQIDTSTSDDFGSILAVELISAFYYVDPAMESNSEAASCVGSINEFKNQVVEFGNFQLGYQCLNTTVDDPNGAGPQYVVYYNALISVIIGAVVAYFVFVYCIKVGVRMVQLMFLEIIAPLAIVSYALPKKDTMFSKWLKMYISTYIDVFIRIAIINFVAFLIAVLFANEESFIFWGTIGEVTSKEKNWITVIIVIALLTFAKKMPELLGDLIGKGASKLGFGVSSPKQLFDGMLGGNAVKAGLRTATVGTAIAGAGFLTSGVSRFRMNMKNSNPKDARAFGKAFLGAAGGAFMAAGRGYRAGLTSKGNVFSSVSKGLSEQRSIDDKYDQLVSSGGNQWGSFVSKATSHFGETKGQMYNRQIKDYETISKANSSIKDLAEGFDEVKKAKSVYDKAVALGKDGDEIQRALDAYKSKRKECITRALSDPSSFSDYEDKSVVSQIKVVAKETESLIKTRDIKVYDSNNVRVTEFTSAEALNDAAISANNSISDIKGPEYAKAIAEDAHAGVDSNATKK